MKVKLNNYIATFFTDKDKTLIYDTCKNILYLDKKPIANQTVNIRKLKRLLLSYEEDTDIRLKEKEQALLKRLSDTRRKYNRPPKTTRKRQKAFFGLI